MMKLKLSLKILAKPALVLVSVISILFSGCSSRIEPTYKEKDIPYIIKRICKEEYKLDVTAKRIHNTIWIYAPLDRILSKDYGLKEDKIFDEEVLDKIRNIISTIGRVLISSDNTPEFFVFTASDIKLGIDYTMIGSVLDIKKSYADFIPWMEANRRYVNRFRVVSEAIGDASGLHLTPHDITMGDFLAEQIAQRIGARFQDEELKKYFKVDKSEGRLNEGVFSFEYSITRTAEPKEKIDIDNEALKIITYCLKAYEFNDFTEITLIDSNTQNKITLNKAAILNRPNGL
ncbi:MAG: hypothetical protein PHY88_01445 [Candidatus Omnitrophica bacterium]|nr:hypothetical protein [Candidatus Omnitrophota bacterium]